MKKHCLFSCGLALLLCTALLPVVSVADSVTVDGAAGSEVTATEEITATEAETLPPVTIAEVFEDRITYTVSETGEVTIDSYFGRAEEVEIPDTIDGYSVVAIGEGCFAGNQYITSVVIPDSVTTIANFAFYSCRVMTSATFGSGVKTIGESAFAACDLLQPGTLPEGLETIGAGAFSSCYELHSINIPSTVTTIGENAFRACWNNFERIDIPASVTYIGSGAFSRCYKLTGIWVDENNPAYSSDSHGALYNKDQTHLYRLPGGFTGDYVMPDTVTEMEPGAAANVASTGTLTISDNLTVIPNEAFVSSAFTKLILGNGVTRIGEYAFGFCSLLKDFSFPESVTTIESYAFYSCDDLRTVTIPETVKTCGVKAFYGCEDLNYVYLPNSFYSIPEGMFSNCDYLIEVSLPETLTSIGPEAFYKCERLQELMIPATVFSIGTDAFTYCYNLSTLVFLGDAPAIADPSMTQMTATAYYPADNETWTAGKLLNYGSYSEITWIAYEAGTTPWDPVEVIPEGLEYSVTNEIVTVTGYTGTAEEITIPSTIEGYPVKYIGSRAFYDQDTLVRVNLPEGLQDIKASAFYKCSSLTSIDIPEGVTSIYSYAFAWCSALREITFPTTLTGIGENAFLDCDSLISVTLPDGVDIVAEGLFSDCNNLTSVTLSDTTKIIEGGAFSVCGSLESIELPATVTTIYSDAFYGCDSLTGIWVHEDNTVYSSDAAGVLFDKEKTALIKYPGGRNGAYTVPETVTAIREAAFANSDLTAITLPEALTSVGEYAFEGCAQLVSVVIPQNVTSLPYTAFERCTGLTAVWVDADNTAFSSDDSGVLFNKDKTELILMPDGFVGGYEVPAGVTTIGPSAFTECCGPTEITLPDSIRTISEYAFYGSSSITRVTVPKTIMEIGSYAFEDSKNLVIRCDIGSYGESYAKSNDIPYEYISGVTALTIASMPTKLTYPLNSQIRLKGLQLNATLEDGTTMSVTSGFKADPVDTSTGGEKTVTVCWSGLPVSFTVTVDAALVEYPESEHPYGKNTDETWTYVHSAAADELQVTFSADTETEENWDIIYIYDADGNELGQYSGTALAGKTVTVPGNSFSVRLTSDGVGCYNGFAVTQIEAVTFGTDTETTEPETDPVATEPVVTEPAASEPVTGCTHENCQWAVVQQPTFTAVGQQQAVCPDCGETFTQELPCLEGKVDQWNISLQDDLRVNFHLAISQSIESTARVKILVGNDAVTYRVSALSKTEDGLYMVNANIAAAQMTDYIIVMVMSGSSVSTSTYTVRQYADMVLADESLSGYHAMVREMLNYGAAAQAYFEYDADMAANEGITGAEAEDIPEEAENAVSYTGGAEGVHFYAASLLYRDKVALRFYFKASADIDSYSFAVSGQTYTPQLKNGLYYIEYPGILPENLDKPVEVTVTDGSGNALTVSYSPMNYIVRMNQKGSDSLKALLKALYNYHLAAKALRAA